MSARYDCADAEQKEAGLVAAVTAIQQGGLVVLPTDTVYGLGADAFTPQAITALDTAKGRSRSVPPPVLVGSVRAAAALTESLGAFGQDLIDEFWPGPLTLILRASPTLKWDLGDARGTVSVRMPLHPAALDLLRRTGPMAVTGANRKGQLAATTVSGAEEQFGEDVSVYLDDGECSGTAVSTIVDLTGTVPRVLRSGAITADQLRKVVPLIDVEEAAPDQPEPENKRESADDRADKLISGTADTSTSTTSSTADPGPGDGADDETSS
ncbi:MAG TPA: L-threonylcarbamoyladenylate synthase [Trebonia sp.]|jgi:tRNA threonylcarbamoyl adenosine modification protein (Sua5/YciO/YrdC/YwlC family)